VRAGIYLRISSDRTHEGLGVARQEEDCRRLAGSRGWEIVETYRDNDTSAYDPRKAHKRVEYRRLLDDLRSGHINAVITWHPDRCFGHPRELEDLIDLVNGSKVQIATVQTGSYDLSTPSGRMVARALGAASRFEREMKAERQARKHEELALAGREAGGGTRPFGYQRNRKTIYQREAKLIREAAGRVLAGESLRGILTDWAARRVKTPTGGTWKQHSLRRMLMSPRIAGLRQHQGVVVGDAEWKGIIDRATHERIKRVLSDPGRRTNGLSRSYLLTGLLVCGRCGVDAGVKLVARPREDKRRQYVCASGPNFSGCGALTTLAEPVEELIAEAIFVRVDGRRLAAAMKQAEGDRGDRVVAELADVEQRQSDLADDFADGRISRAEWLRARDRLAARAEQARRRLATDTRSAALAPYSTKGALRAAWPELSFDKRRAVVGALVDRIVVNPAVRGRNTFDPTRFDVVWRT
jgi:site-specific DNA recombinase